MRSVKFLHFSALSWAAIHYSPTANSCLASEMSDTWIFVKTNYLCSWTTLASRSMQLQFALCLPFFAACVFVRIVVTGAGVVIYVPKIVGFASESQSLCHPVSLPAIVVLLVPSSPPVHPLFMDINGRGRCCTACTSRTGLHSLARAFRPRIANRL